MASATLFLEGKIRVEGLWLLAGDATRKGVHPKPRVPLQRRLCEAVFEASGAEIRPAIPNCQEEERGREHSSVRSLFLGPGHGYTV